MSIESKDIKLLWGRAAGRCSHCNTDLTYTLSSQESISIGEMAHVIARKENGPRGSEKIAPELLNTYCNLILLCNNHHEMIDKAPQSFSVDEILEWKKRHEEVISANISGEHFTSKKALNEAIKKLLMCNNAIYMQYGPQSEVAMRNPTSIAKRMWDALKLSTILPNNRKIINVVEENLSYLSADEYEIFLRFKMHAISFEDNAYERSDNECVTLFPNSFRVMIFGGGNN